MASDLPGWDDVVKGFVSLVVKSPVAIVTMVISVFLGYGIAFVVFDYRRTEVMKSHRIFHLAFGLAYAAVIFCVVNFDILSRALTLDQISTRAPLTLLISFVVAFPIMLFGACWREFYAPYYKAGTRIEANRQQRPGGADGDRN